MRCMKTKTTHGDKDPNPRNKYNLTPETARVGVQMGKVTSGALHFINQAKYTQDMLKRFKLSDVKPASTPMPTKC